MGHPFRHFLLVVRHRHRVIRNGARMGIFWQALGHDLSKFGWAEFRSSAAYYVGKSSPVYEQRLHEGYFSSICQRHTRKNRHHWEYWTDFFRGRIVMKTMPWRYATEYVCDVLSAAATYDPRGFRRETALLYFRRHADAYFMTAATRDYIDWCLERYRDAGFAALRKRLTKAKYREITARLPTVEIVETPKAVPILPALAK